jgi:site-specific DNA-methyltransferase (adenine-specific)
MDIEQYKNKPYHGDCLDFMKNVPDNYFDLILTDPPYKLSSTKPGISNLMSLSKFNSNSYIELTNGFDVDLHFNEYKRILNKFNLFCFCSNNQLAEIMEWGQAQKFYTTCLVWHKNNSTPFANGVWRGDIEFCVHIREKGAYFEGSAHMKQKVTTISVNRSQFGHPTEKPMQLIKKYLMIGSDRHYRIFDPFLGSGTTAIACKSMGLDWWGCELQQEYINVIERRLTETQMDLFGI